MKYLVIVIVILLLAVSARAQETFSGQISIYPAWHHVTVRGSSTISEKYTHLLRQSHTSGTNASQMNAIVGYSQSLTNSQTVTYNLAGGVENCFGDTVTFYRVNFMSIKASVDNVSTLDIGNASTNVFFSWLGSSDQTILIPPGGFFMLTAPDATGFPSQNGNLKIANSGTNSASYELYVGGAQ